MTSKGKSKPSPKRPAAKKKPVGRPTIYKAEYAEQARKLCLILNASDEQIAWFFGVSIHELAVWAMENSLFLIAISPSDADIKSYAEARVAAAEKRSSARKKHYASNPSARLRSATASRIWAALKGRSDGALFSRLGYSLDDLMAHLESQFTDGMSWENYGAWHVDHKKPCVLFNLKDKDQFSECWSLSNLSPLWAKDNIKKGASYVC